jgi:pyruvate/2-oxoglutarate/acetoin dehydrogenase E1 component
MSDYFDELCRAMTLLAEQPRSVFVGQAVKFPGTAMRNTLKHLPDEKLLEFPVAEDCQMGFCTGMALAGDLPICIYPRFNFLLLATNQLVLHLDKLPLYSRGGYEPKVIIRTAIATDQPLNPGEQHLGDFSIAYQLMLRTVRIVRLDEADEIVPEYLHALGRPGPTILVERMERY